MVIQYCSDLHLEFKENREYMKSNPISAIGDILVLAGDIVPFAVMDKHKDFFSYVADHFSAIYWLPGNHEYYYSDIADKSGVLNEKIRGNVFLVNNTSVDYEDIRLIFSTLWSTINPVNQWHIEHGMNDFQVIKFKGKRFSVPVYNQLHAESRDFIQAQLNNKRTGKTVVITHHVPTFQNYPVRYKNDILSEAFAVELFSLIEQTSPDFWIYGHHHTNGTSFKIGLTAMLTNQLGYVKYNEHQGFRPDQHILL